MLPLPQGTKFKEIFLGPWFLPWQSVNEHLDPSATGHRAREAYSPEYWVGICKTGGQREAVREAESPEISPYKEAQLIVDKAAKYI